MERTLPVKMTFKPPFVIKHNLCVSVVLRCNGLNFVPYLECQNKILLSNVNTSGIYLLELYIIPNCR